jgi:hypothetical protein
MQQSIIRLELSLAAGVVLGPILMRSLWVYMTVSEIQNPEKYTTKLSAPRDTYSSGHHAHGHTTYERSLACKHRPIHFQPFVCQ